MLPKKNLWLTFACFRAYSTINFIPLKFNMKEGTVEFRSSILRLLLWKISYAIASGHMIYMTYQIFHSLMDTQYFSFFNFPIHFIHCFVIQAGVFYTYLLFFQMPFHTIAIFNETHKSLFKRDRGQWRRLKDCTFQEHFMMNFSASLVYVLFWVFFGLFVYDRERVQLVFSGLPQEYQNELIFWALLVGEFTIYNFGFGLCGYVVYSQLNFFHKCLELADANNFRGALSSPVNICTQFRKLQLLIQIFNQCHSKIVFIIKIFHITAAVSFFSFGVHCFHETALGSGINVAFGLYSCSIFVSIYDKAFAIPLKIRQLKDQLLQDFCRKNCNGTERSELGGVYWKMKTVTASFPNLGIRVGSFMTLKPTSTPEFLDFVAEKTTSLLVSFRN